MTGEGHDEARLIARWVTRVHSPENVMPRRKLARRFEPRFGVNLSMVDEECKWVQRELEDKLLGSTNDLREKLSELHSKVVSAEIGLSTTLGTFPDRERLALKCMLARDVFHIAALYETFLRSSLVVQNATGAVTEVPEEVNQEGEAQPVLLFQESLFD